MIALGDVLSGRYKIVSKVAEGGMATIFLASSIGADGTPRSVAIKAIKPELIDNADLVRQFMQEASVGTSLIHDNIVRVEDFGEHKGAYFMVLEYVAGKDLGGLIRALRKTRRCLSPRMVAHVAAGVCAALECAHRHIDEQGQFAPVIHRDISPANILLSYDGQVKLADFGIARVLGSVRMTQAGMLKGKYSYMSPEQSKGSEVDARSDLFSLGIVMWESLTARKLFKGKTAKDKLVKVRSATVPNLAEIASHVDAEMCRIVHKSLQLAPGDRFQTAQEMETFLRAFVGRTGDIDAGNLSALLADCFPEDDLSSIIADPIISAELEIAEEEEEVASTIVVEPPNFDEVSPNVGAHTVILFNVPAQTATPPPRAAHSDVGSRTPPYPGNQPLTPPPQRADVHHDGGVGVSHGGVTVKPIGGLTPPPRPLPSNPVEPQKTSEAGTLLGVPIPRGAPTQGQPPGQQPSEYAFTTPGQAQQTPATLILTPTPPPSPADTLPQPQLEPLPESPPPQQYLTSEPSQPESLTPAAPSPPQISTAQPGGSPTLATFPEGRALTPVSLPTFPEGVPAQPMSTYPELETNRPRDDKDQPTQRSERSRLLISFLIGVPTSLAIAIIVYILLMRFVIGPE